LSTYPALGATDVPTEIGVAVWLIFSGLVRFSWHHDIEFHSEVALVSTLNFNNSVINNISHLVELPRHNAVKVLIPADYAGKTLLQRAEFFKVRFPKGSLLDVKGRALGEVEATFRCLSGNRDRGPPELVMHSPRFDQGPIPANTRTLDFYFTEDIRTRVGRNFRFRKQSSSGGGFPKDVFIFTIDPAVQTVGSRLTFTLPQDLISDGGSYEVRLTQGAFFDIPRVAKEGISEGGTNDFGQVSLEFTVVADRELPSLILAESFPPHEVSPTFKLPPSVAVVLSLTEPVSIGSGYITLVPRYGNVNVRIPVDKVEVVGNRVFADPPGLAHGEVYRILIDHGAFLDGQQNPFNGSHPEYVISVAPYIRFTEMGDGHWADPAQLVTGARFGVGAAVDASNTIYVLGGRNGTMGAQEGSLLNDVWRLQTGREVSCASYFEPSERCSATQCMLDDTGKYNFGHTTLLRRVWKRRSARGTSCADAHGLPMSRFGKVVITRTDVCPCPMCVKPPGPASGVPLHSLRQDDTFINAYVKVLAANETRPMLCQEGRIPSGPFTCEVDTRYYGRWKVPYPNCDEPTGCIYPPDTTSVPGFFGFDSGKSSEGRDCAAIGPDNFLRHGQHCTPLCGPGLRANATFLCQTGSFGVIGCERQSCGGNSIPFGLLKCDTPGPDMGSVCSVTCEFGYTPKNATVNCTTATSEPESKPQLLPAPRCVPSECGDFPYPDGLLIRYSSPGQTVSALGDTATAACKEGYEAVDTAALELVCGRKTQAIGVGNAEWQVKITGQRAGLLCSRVGVTVRLVVVIEGSLSMDLAPPPGEKLEDFCQGDKWDAFNFGLSMAVALAFASISEAGYVPSTEVDVYSVSMCDAIRGVVANGGGGRRLGTPQKVRYRVVIPTVEAALKLKALLDDPKVSAGFSRIFAVALAQATGMTVTNARASPIVVSMTYPIVEPTTTTLLAKNTTTPLVQTTAAPVVQGAESDMDALTSFDFAKLSAGVLAGIGVGATALLGCLCTCAVACCLWCRRRRRKKRSRVGDYDDSFHDVADDKDHEIIKWKVPDGGSDNVGLRQAAQAS